MKLPILQNSACFGEPQEEKLSAVHQRLPKHYVREQALWGDSELRGDLTQRCQVPVVLQHHLPVQIPLSKI